MKTLSKARRFLVMALSIVCILFSSMPAMAAEQIAISQKKASLNIGEEISLSVLHTDAKPVWYSSNINIADVDSTGKVVAVSKGSATITARIGAKKYNSKITVNAPTIKLNKNTATIYTKGTSTSTVKLKATVKGARKDVTWESMNPMVATVDNQGNVTSVSKGITTIKATANGVDATCVLKVLESSISLNYTDVSLGTKGTGNSVKLVPDIVGSKKSVKWVSSDKTIAVVSGGKVTGKKPGTVVITATANGVDAVCNVTVVENVVTIGAESSLLYVGDTTTLKTNATADMSLLWESSNPEVVSVENGVLQALSVGTSLISVKEAGKEVSDTCLVTVKEKAFNIKEETVELSLYGTGKNYTLETDIVGPSKTITWKSSDPKIVSVSKGKLTAKKEGSVVITATANGVTDTVPVTVVYNPSVKLNYKSYSLHTVSGKNVTLKATVTGVSKKVTWTSSDETIATVDSKGKVTAIAPGSVKIIATANDVSAECVIRVIETRTALNKETLYLNVDEVYELDYTIIGKSQSAKWTTGNKNVATVKNGVVTAKDYGQTAITLTANGVKTACKVVVTDKKPCEHSFDEGVFTIEPTCVNKGMQTFTCLECGETEITVVDALGHEYGEFEIDVEPTCNESGMKSKHCVRCDLTTESTLVDALEHNFEEKYVLQGTCVTKGVKVLQCSYCYAMNIEETAIAGHSYEKTSGTDVTCETDGDAIYTCSVCGNSYHETTTALGHDYSGGFVVKTEATCTTDGLKSIPCSRCDSEIEETVIPALGHSITEYTTSTEPTCESKGIKAGTCSACGETVEEDIDALGHDYATNFTTDTEATCETDGSKSKHCSRCTSKVEITVIPAHGHNMVNGTCSHCGYTKSYTEITLTKGDLTKAGISTTGNVVIPETFEYNGVTYKVTGLGEGVFSGCNQITSITIPDSVTSIDDAAFSFCTGLQTITIPGSVEKIGDAAFMGCTSLESVIIMEGVTEIGANAFNGCTSLETVTIPDTVTKIGENAFYNCTDIETLVIPDSVTEIGADAFKGVGHVIYNGPAQGAPWGANDYNNVCAEGNHSYGDFVVDIPATCTSVGSKSKHCSVCGNKAEITEIPMLPHTYNNGVETTAPTCETKGIKTYTCSVCSHSYDADIPALGHDYSNEFTVDIEATCTAEGSKSRHCSRCESKTEITVIDKTDHTYNDGVETLAPTCESNGVKTYTCSVCGDTKTEDISALGHNYSDEFTTDTEATCTSVGSKSKHCSRCSSKSEVTEIPMASHSYNSGEITSEPSCEGLGVKTYTCSVCSHTYDTDVAALGHDYADEFTTDVAPTCNTKGSKSKHCSRCESKTEITSITELGHDFGEWVVTTPATEQNTGIKKRECNRCDYFEEGVVPVIGHTHNYETSVTAPTCEADGYTTYTCACGDTYTDDIVPALGHDYADEFTVDTEATCTTDGSKSKHCSRCDSKSEVTVIPALGHTVESYNETTAPTCEGKGVETGECTVCGESVNREIDALGHDYSEEFTTDVEPTCVAEGSKSKHCSRCENKTEITAVPIDNSKHSYDSGVITTEATCTDAGIKTYTCLLCSVSTTEPVDALGHDISDEFTVDTEATCITEGSKSKHCSRCEHKDEITVIPKGTHNFVDNVCTGCGAYDEYEEKVLLASDLANAGISTTGAVVVPEYYKHEDNFYRVVGIGDYAFENCTNITSVQLPDSITSLGIGVFKNCSNLTTVNLSDNITSVGAGVFKSCSKLNNVHIPNTLTRIPSNMFYGCTSLTNIEMTDVVDTIGDYAFGECKKLKDVTFSQNLVTVEDNAFQNCTAMVSTPPNSIKNVGVNAFRECLSITGETTLSLASVGSYAFGVYNGLSSWKLTLSFEDTVNTIPATLCQGIKDLRVGTIPSSVTKIENYAFNIGGEGTTPNITIPNSVTSIGTNAFRGVKHIVYYGNASGSPWGALARNTLCEYGCHNFSLSFTVDVEPTCTTDGSKSKHCTKCDEKTEVTVIPHLIHDFVDDVCTLCGAAGEITDIIITADDLAKIGITNTGNVVIPERYEYDGKYYRIVGIGESTFEACTGLTQVTIPNTVTSIGRNAFKGCTGLTKAILPTSLTDVGISAFNGCTKMVATIPNSVRNVGSSAFWECNSLTGTTTLTLDSLGSHAFGNYNGTSLQTMYITLSENITQIPTTVFENSKGLKRIVIPDSVTNIADYAFWGCTGLERVKIPSSVTEIGANAFYNVPEIEYCGSATGSPWGAKKRYYYIEGDFSYLDETKESVQAYLGTDAHMVVPDGVKEIATNMCNHSANTKPTVAVTQITLPDGLEKIGSGAFGGLTNLNTVNIPSTVTEIGSSAFSGCKYLTSPIVIPEGVTTIASFTFSECYRIPSITLPEGLTVINGYAFEDCYALTGNLELPDGLTTIGEWAFKNCTGLDNIAIPDSVTYIHQFAFSQVKHITYNGSYMTNAPWSALAINSDCTYMGGHNYSDEFTVDTPATCIAEGSKSKHCTRCNDKTEVTVIPADPSLHDYSEEVTAEATCTEMGINTYTCTICSDTYAESIDALGHNYVNDICTRCSITKPNGDIVEDTVPDEEFIPELDNHEHDYHVHIVNASCESNGYTDYICSCGHHYTDTEVSALGHNVVAGECTNCNYTVAGLYLEDGTMVATWEESGIDVEKNYSLGYGLQDSIQTNTTGAFYVLSTKYRGQRVTKLVLPSDITSIGNNALWGVRTASQGTNTYVTNIVIPSNITNISESALSTFSGSVAYKSFTLTAENYEQAGISRTGDIVIPKTFEYEGDSYYVTTIGASAFAHCMDITSVVIPDSVTVIEKNAFYVCKNLASVSMPDSITRIGDSAFQGCAFETIHIPVKVKVIDVLAFYNCPSLQTVILPHGITSIESHAFGNCANLSETNIPCTVKSIKGRAFMSCEKLTEVIIPDGVTTIGVYAFLDVPHITYHGSASGRPWGAKEMNSCATLGHNFADEFTVDLEPTCVTDGSKSKHCSECGAVTEETVIPADPSLHDYVEEVTTEPTCTEKGVTTYTCNYCSDTYTEEIATLEHDYSETILTEPTCESPGTKCITCTVCGDTHEEELAALGHDYVNGTCVKCGNMVAGAYDSDNNLIVSWDDLVNVYGLDIEKDYGYQTYKTDTSSFYYILTNNDSLSGMTRLIIPDNISTIGNNAFNGCTGLTNVNLGNNVTSIGNNAFSGCNGLISIDFPNSVTSIGESAFYGCSELTNVNFGTQLSGIGNSAFSYCVNLTSIVIPDSVTTFGKYIFNGCTNLTNVDIGNGVVTIGENTFTCCVNLTDVTLGNNVSSIESSAFMSCSKLNTIVIPDSVTLIGSYAFSECTELSDLTIPNSVTSIGTNAFSNVPHITYNGPAEGSPWGALSIN